MFLTCFIGYICAQHIVSEFACYPIFSKTSRSYCVSCFFAFFSLLLISDLCLLLRHRIANWCQDPPPQKNLYYSLLFPRKSPCLHKFLNHHVHVYSYCMTCQASPAFVGDSHRANLFVILLLSYLPPLFSRFFNSWIVCSLMRTYSFLAFQYFFFHPFKSLPCIPW